jgi:hypothetical protein
MNTYQLMTEDGDQHRLIQTDAPEDMVAAQWKVSIDEEDEEEHLVDFLVEKGYQAQVLWVDAEIHP